MYLSKYNFAFPPLWAQSSAGNAEHPVDEVGRMLALLARSFQLIQPFVDRPLTPEIVAYLTLWTRNAVITEAGVGLTRGRSKFGLECFWRLSFDLNLQLSVILRPAQRGATEADLNRSEVANRLCGYLAWCLWCDVRYLNDLLRPDNAERVWAPDLAEALERDPSLIRFIDALWGDKEVDSPPALLEKRRDQRDRLFHFRNTLRDWQSHDRVREWVERLRSSRVHSFLELVDPSAASVAATLRRDDQAWAYPAYQLASNCIHGSTLLGVLDIYEDTLTPSLFNSEAEAASSAADLRRFCHNNIVLLESLRALVDQGSSEDA